MSWEDDILKKLRKERELTQAQFAEWLEIPRRTYEKWESEESVPPTWVIKLIQFKCEKSTQGEQINIEDLIPKKKYYVLHTIYVSGQEFYKIYTPNDPNFKADVNFMKEQDKKGYKYSPTWETFEVYQNLT